MGGRRHALGQHFLADNSFVHRTIALAGLPAGSSVLEIGPGKGALTFPLLDAGYHVTAVEFDRSLAENLAAIAPERLRVEQADFLRFDFSRLPDGPLFVVANLPYSTGTAILTRLLEMPEKFPRIVVMLQREVAQRLVAGPGSRAYGSLSIFTQMQAEVQMGFSVPPEAFRPPPRVDSAVVRLDLSVAPRFRCADPQAFRRLVRSAFAQRRKTLRNSLGSVYGKEIALAAMARAGIDPIRRAETVSIPEFCALEVAFGPDA
jgi:16S rRNA (adenine1518-N6/adenine1519-N6)-dimethyltransferase